MSSENMDFFNLFSKSAEELVNKDFRDVLVNVGPCFTDRQAPRSDFEAAGVGVIIVTHTKLTNEIVSMSEFVVYRLG
jgi:hypothetical protein